jgi:hypothetical protein
VGLEPTLPHYGCGVLAAERPVLALAQQVGPEGLEPSPTWLRARHAAANTLIPCVYPSGAGGIRTHASQIKSLLCCRYTTTPRAAVALFLPVPSDHFSYLQKKDQKSRSGWSRTTVFALSERRASVALPSVHTPPLPSRDDWNRTSFLVFPKHAGSRRPTSRFVVSEKRSPLTPSPSPARGEGRRSHSSPKMTRADA